MKKIIKTLLVVMVVVLALTAFVGCNECQHTGGTATCTEAAVCELCGESYGEALGHKGGAATCTEKAVCEVCGESYGEAAGHKVVKLPAIEATCSKEGRTEGSRCSECKEILVAQEVIEKLEHHVWVDNVDRDFTCELDGFTGGKHCEICGVQDGTVVVTPAHCVWGEDYVHTAPTCGETGILAHDCTVCGKTEKVADIPATGEHNFTVDVEAQDATCLPGWNAHKVCEVCGTPDETYEEIPGDSQNGHSFPEENCFYYPEPTCTEGGYLAGTCEYCGNSYYLAELPAAHKYVDGVCTVCGEAEPEHVHEWSDATCTEPAKCECGETQGEALGHAYTDGICDNCGATDPNHYFVVSIADALKKGEGDKVQLTGTVTEIYQAYNSQYDNISVYITDENGDRILLFRLPGNYGIGDKLTIKGTITMYNEKPQIAQGAEVVSSEKHVCSEFSEATCINKAKCVVCGVETGEFADHVFVDGKCECGAEEGVQLITVSKTMKELITANGWTSSTTKQSFTLDDVVSVKIDGGSNTGKAYNGDHIRIYATDSPAGTITISVPEGYELVSIKISTETGTYAFLYVDGTTTDISNETVSVSGNSVLLNSVKNGSDGKQVRVTGIEVTYKPVSE